MHVLGTRVPRRFGVARSASSLKAAQALGFSLTPGLRISFGRVTCMARAASVPGLWALDFLLLCGVCVWVRFAVGCGFCLPRQSWLGSWVGVFGHGLWCCPSSAGCLWCSWLGLGFGLLMGRVWFCARSTCPPLFPVPVCGVGVRAGPGSRLCPALLGWVVGACFLRFFFLLCGVGCWVSLSRALWSLSPHPLSFGLGCWLFFFFFPGVCLHVSVFLFPVGRCSWLGVASFGWVVPLCLFGGPVLGAFWVGALAASGGVGGRFGGCGLFSRPPPLPPLFSFFRGGGGLPVPPSAFPGLAHALAHIQCCLPGCCWRLRSVWPCSGPMARLGYVHVGLGAPSCRVRSWLCRLGGCARRLRVAQGLGAGVVRVLSPLRCRF